MTVDATGRSLVARERRQRQGSAATIEGGNHASTTNEEVGSASLRKDGEVDLMKNNRGSGKRTTYSSKDKWDMIEDFKVRQSQQKK